MDDCERPHFAKDFCKKHYTRVRTTGTPHQVGVHYVTNFRGDLVTYNGMHTRLRTIRGPAIDQTCTHCGNAARAWAYDHADPNERIQMVTNSKGAVVQAPFSVDISHYMPLCASCHSRFDRQWAKVGRR